MHRVNLQGIDIKISRLSFGTGSLHHILTSQRRQRLLAAALYHGFSHFDTSPYYGFGMAEEELGKFMRSHRNSVTTTTKVGLYPPRDLRPTSVCIWTTKLLGKIMPTLSRPTVDWSIAAAARSLDCSLRRLGSDHVDLLLLHEPVSGAVESEVFLDWLTRERAKGKIRGWGLAGHAACMDNWLSVNHLLGMVLQVRDSLDRKEADTVKIYGRNLQFTYGYLSSAQRFSGELNATKILEKALRRNAHGSIIVSTRKLARLKELATVVQE